MRAAIEASGHTHQLQDGLDGSFYCPMDPDVRSIRPGRCSRCGMTLVEGVPDIVEYPLDLTLEPPLPRVTELTRLTFRITDPRILRPVRNFEVVHEKLYHLFVVSQDLSFFLHAHPERQPDEDFHLDLRFPRPGMYRVLSDFYPSGGTPQLITNTVIVPGPLSSLETASIGADMSPKGTENSRVELDTVPARAVARQKVSLFFRITPDQGVEPYLGAWGHMLAVSSDLIDMVHHHPVTAVDARGNSSKRLQFDLAFARPGVHRVWLQFQRSGIVNTVAFNVPVDEPPQ
jgi:hypothetical protein